MFRHSDVPIKNQITEQQRRMLLSGLAAALAAGCAHPVNTPVGGGATIPKATPPIAAQRPADIAKPPAEPAQPAPKAHSASLYSVTITPSSPTIRVTGNKGQTVLAVHNTGKDIPALSLWFDGTGPLCTVRSVRSNASDQPVPVMVDRGQGWDFGPLRNGKTAHITVHLNVPQNRQPKIVIKPYAVAEDEGDSERTIDQHIPGGDQTVTVVTQPVQVAPAV